MSSHHIVREKQEPALIIANGEACSEELLGQLLEWSPFIVVLDGAIDRVLALHIKVDVLFGDFDNPDIDFDEIKNAQFPLEIVHALDQEKTDLEKAIEFLIDRGFPAANIIWATGKRADHTFANISNLPKYRNQIKLKMLDDYSCIFPLQPLPEIYSKWYLAQTKLSLFAISKVENLSTSNLKYSLSNASLELGVRNGNSNETLNEGLVTIQFESGELLIMECND
jgi:thiamine pyrophosphokinase